MPVCRQCARWFAARKVDRKRPAGRVVGEADQQCARRDGGQQRRYRVASAVGVRRSATWQARAQDDGAARVGPDGRGRPPPRRRRRSESACMATTSALTPPEVMASRSGARPSPQPAGGGGDGGAQLRQAQVVRIKGLAGLQRGDAGGAHRLGRDFVAFAGTRTAARHGAPCPRWLLHDLGFFEVRTA